MYLGQIEKTFVSLSHSFFSCLLFYVTSGIQPSGYKPGSEDMVDACRELVENGRFAIRDEFMQPL